MSGLPPKADIYRPLSDVRELPEHVSVTDMKIEIKNSDVLQLRSVVHMSRLPRPAQRRFLDQIVC